MNLKKRALHVTVLASMVGAMGSVAAAPAAHAATVLIPSCGVYMQGGIDPAGGIIPAGTIPFPANGNTSGQKTYVLRGTEAKGQDKTISDLHNTTAGAKVFSLGVTINDAPLQGGTGTTSVKIAQKRDTNTGSLTLPTIQVAEATPLKMPVTKGVVVGMPGADKAGVATGNVRHAANPLGASPGSEIDSIVIPSTATAADTFQLSMTFPAPISATLTTPNIAANASAATIQATLQGLFTAAGPPLSGGAAGISVTGSTMVPGASNGSFTVDMTSIVTGLGGPANVPALPALSAPAAGESAGLQAAALDDGSLTSGLRYGGVDPSIDPIVDFGAGVYVAQGVFSNGNIPAVGFKNTGKSGFTPDTQALFLQYPVAIATSDPSGNLVGPNVATAQALLQAIVGANLTVTTSACDVLGVLALFCGAASGSIPPSFSGICALLA